MNVRKDTSSARACLESDEQSSRATKKVKSCEQEEVVTDISMEDKVAEMNASSFKEALLNIPGITGEDEMFDLERDEEDLPENRWYKEDRQGEIPHVSGGIPNIPVSDKELED